MRRLYLAFLFGVVIGIVLNGVHYFDCRDCSKAYIKQAQYTKGIDLYLFGEVYRIFTWK